MDKLNILLGNLKDRGKEIDTQIERFKSKKEIVEILIYEIESLIDNNNEND